MEKIRPVCHINGKVPMILHQSTIVVLGNTINNNATALQDVIDHLEEIEKRLDKIEKRLDKAERLLVD